MTTPTNFKELLRNLKDDGAFDCENRRSNVINYFQGQIHALESIKIQIAKLTDFLDLVKNDFTQVVTYTECFDKTEH